MEEPIVVIVTEPEYRKAERVFVDAPGVRCVAAPQDELQLSAAIHRAGARAVIVGVSSYRDGLYDVLPAGGVIARFGVGHDGIDKARATRAGILCTNTPGVLDQSVAELTMLMLLAAARQLPSLVAGMSTRTWSPRQGSELRELTLAVVGCGRIGRAVAAIAGTGFGMRVHCIGRQDDYHAAVREADFVSVHLPATEATRHVIDRQRLAAMSARAWLINTSRGSVVDERALYDALAEGRLAGAALDVFETEPYAPQDPARDLRTLSNVILTPHVGSNTAQANARMAERALQNVRHSAARRYGEMDLLNPDVIATIGNHEGQQSP